MWTCCEAWKNLILTEHTHSALSYKMLGLIYRFCGIRILEYSLGVNQHVLPFQYLYFVLQIMDWEIEEFSGITGELVVKHGRIWYSQSIPTLHYLNKMLGLIYRFCDILSTIRQKWHCIQWSFGSFNILCYRCMTNFYWDQEHNRTWEIFKLVSKANAKLCN